MHVDEKNNIDQNQLSFDRSTTLLDSILRKIELDQKWYHKLLSILKDFSDLKDIRCEVNKTRLDIHQLSDTTSAHFDERALDLAIRSEQMMSPTEESTPTPDHRSIISEHQDGSKY